MRNFLEPNMSEIGTVSAPAHLPERLEKASRPFDADEFEL